MQRYEGFYNCKDSEVIGLNTFQNILKSHKKHSDSLFCVTTEGVMLGKNLNDKLMIAKTYISYEMLKRSQVDDREIMLEWLLDYIKKVQ